jgi:hypothetical protein
LPCVFLPAHGKGCNVPFGVGAVSCFSLPCASPWRTAKKVHRALSEKAHGNGSLPCKLLPCALCRAPRWKTHGKNFAVRFWAFAVRPWRTANLKFPVVGVGLPRWALVPVGVQQRAWACPGEP